jgi:hypothetical protein
MAEAILADSATHLDPILFAPSPPCTQLCARANLAIRLGRAR